jgi:hypothetical protein
MNHEELKKIYALDALESDTPYDMWEFMNYMGKWQQHTKEPSWLPDYQYRRKQTRQAMKQINNQREFMQALLDGETVFNNHDYFRAYWKLNGNIVDIIGGLKKYPKKYPVYIKQKTININGFEVPEPLRKAPEDGDMCYCAFLSGGPYSFNFNQEFYPHVVWLEAGVLHYSAESAEIHRNALLSFTRQDTK